MNKRLARKVAQRLCSRELDSAIAAGWDIAASANGLWGLTVKEGSADHRRIEEAIEEIIQGLFNKSIDNNSLAQPS